MNAKPKVVAAPAAGSDVSALPKKLQPLRAISFGDPAVSVERRDGEIVYLRPKSPLGDYPARLTDRLEHWATAAPGRVFLAERESGGGWRQFSYRQFLDSIRRVASALLARDLSAERPIVILSGNSIDHALLAFGALYAGIPYCPVSPAYSLVSKDYARLDFVLKLLTPGLVFAADADGFAGVLRANIPADVEIAVSRGTVAGRDVTMLARCWRRASIRASRPRATRLAPTASPNSC